MGPMWATPNAALRRTGFEGVERVPSMFVLLGNFQSFACASASTDYAAVAENFGALAQLLASFPRIMVRMHAPTCTEALPL